MSETILVEKKKKYNEIVKRLRKKEDAYDNAEQDLKSKEYDLISDVHKEYLKAENKGEFFEKLQKSEAWYYNKFREHDFSTQYSEISESHKQVHAERKKQSIIDDLDKMEKDIQKTKGLEIDKTLIEGTKYTDPKDEKIDWIQQTKENIMTQEPMKLTKSDSNFGKYQNTKAMLSKCRDITKIDFKVSDKYKNILIHQLEQTVNYLTELLKEVKK